MTPSPSHIAYGALFQASSDTTVPEILHTHTQGMQIKTVCTKTCIKYGTCPHTRACVAFNRLLGIWHTYKEAESVFQE